MPSVMVAVSEIDGETALKLLLGISGPCVISIETIPFRGMRRSLWPSAKTGTQYNVEFLRYVIEQALGKWSHPRFNFVLHYALNLFAAQGDGMVFGDPRNRIHAPQIESGVWSTMSKLAKQSAILEAILVQTSWNRSTLCNAIKISKPVLSSALRGRRRMSALLAGKLIENLPLTDEMIAKIIEVAAKPRKNHK